MTDLWGPLRQAATACRGTHSRVQHMKICDDASLSYFRRIFWKSLFRHFPDSLDFGFGGSYPWAGTYWGHQTVDMTITSDICQNCDDASPRFCFETKLYIRLLISFINDEGSTGPPTAWPNQAIVAFDRPYPGVQYICDDASPRFFVRLDSIWGFCVFGANWEGHVGSPTAWKNKLPRPVAVLIPGYNICKIYDDAMLSYFRRIFWKSLFWPFPDSLDVGFGGVKNSGPNGDTGHGLSILFLDTHSISFINGVPQTPYAKSAMTQVLVILGGGTCGVPYGLEN